MMDSYLTGLRNQSAVEAQAIGTVKNELAQMEPYPKSHAKTRQDRGRSTTQAARLEDVFARHCTKASIVKKAVSGAAATVTGFAHLGHDPPNRVHPSDEHARPCSDERAQSDSRRSDRVLGADDEVLKNVLAAIGFKACEIGSYKALVTMAGVAGHRGAPFARRWPFRTRPAPDGALNAG